MVTGTKESEAIQMGYVERAAGGEVERYYTSQTNKKHNDALDGLAYTFDYMQHKQAQELAKIAAYESGYRAGVRNQRRRYQERRKRCIYFAKQKALGVLMLALSVIIPVAMDGDATPLLITVPMGLALLFSKEMMIYNSYYMEVQERKGR